MLSRHKGNPEVCHPSRKSTQDCLVQKAGWRTIGSNWSINFPLKYLQTGLGSTFHLLGRNLNLISSTVSTYLLDRDFQNVGRVLWWLHEYDQDMVKSKMLGVLGFRDVGMLNKALFARQSLEDFIAWHFEKSGYFTVTTNECLQTSSIWR
jgi:hypothetical protein